MRILVAEDERITRTSLVRQLQRWGHEVVATEDGEGAWEAFQAGEFDLVLTDWEMPRLSGVGLIERIRTETDAQFVYVIMLTSRSEKDDIVKGIEAGANDFVSKPFDRDELRVRVLAGERVVRLERTLSAQNEELRAAGERMRRDLLAAARVQQAMLPRSNVETPRVRTAWTYAPTDELAGDALGFQMLDDRHLLMYVLDVTGHGVPAALLAVTVMHAMSPTGDCTTILRRSGAEGMHRPSLVLNELNRRFCDASTDGRFLTMLLGVLDTESGRLRIARAGHPHPLVLRDGAFIETSDDGGFPLGVMEDAEFVDFEVALRQGDRVALYSDGLVEQAGGPEGGLFGEDRLREILIQQRASAGTEAVPAMMKRLSAWAGGEMFTDDASLMLVDWMGGAGAGESEGRGGAG